MSEAPFYFGMGIGAPDGLPSIAPLRTAEPRQKSATVGEQVMSRSQGGWSGAYGNWSPMSGRRIEQIRHFRLWNYIAISKVAEEASRHRPNVAFVKPHRPQGPQHKILLPGARRVDWNARLHRWSKSLHQIQPHEDVEPVGPDHPIERLFDRPNRWDKGGIHDILEELVIFLRLTGDAYLWAPPDDSGRPRELWCVPSTWVHGPRLDPKGGLWYFMLVPVVAGGSSATGMWFIPHEELIHFAYKNPWHKLLGLSPLQAASEWTDIQDSINFAEYASMKNGCFPTGVLELDKDMHDPDQADLERIYAKFFSRIQGESRFGRPILLAPGMTYNPLNISPEDMLYLESEDRIRDKLLSLHGVPKELVGIQDAGSEIAMYGPLKFFAMNTIGTLHARLARVLTHDLARRFDDSIRIWWDDTSVDSPESRRADIQLGLDKGLLTVDQACAMMGWQAQEIAGWSDVPLLPPTLLPMGEGGQQDGMDGMGGLFGQEDEEEQAPAQPGEPKPREPDEEEDEDEKPPLKATPPVAPVVPAVEKMADPPPALPEPVGVRPELQRALVAVANGEVNGHAPPALPIAPVPVPILTPAPVVIAPVAPASPPRRKRSRRAAGRKFMADLLDGWAAPKPEPPPAPVAPVAPPPDVAGALTAAAKAVETSAASLATAADKLAAAQPMGMRHKVIQGPDGRVDEVLDIPFVVPPEATA